jgi:hypothetical protein
LPRICQQWVFLPCFRHRRLHFHARSKSLTINLKALSFRLFRCRFWGGSNPVGRPIFLRISRAGCALRRLSAPPEGDAIRSEAVNPTGPIGRGSSRAPASRFPTINPLRVGESHRQNHCAGDQ